ncbi:hypothetical protein [Acinetobacter sp. 10FS3-1]|uniref:hypothetical protein n=1 Tax=Acinetobacter sp. 10FS3-1 TaxID=2563897 RepID=UPI00157BC5E5|nr:hypothetical protein [Acinetobacter sp. 10FS3-1]QKQ69945.1 hypothetical protein E5Y90_06720 [Acinetobacter sp. 10FS3-1]
MELIKREITIVLISTAVGIGIIAIVSFFIVWIGFPAENPKDSFKDALSFAGGIFGGLATFGAAIIAAYLFNDWRISHNKNIDAQLCMKVMDSVYDCDLNLLRINSFLVDYLSEPNKISYQRELNVNLNQLRDIINIMASSLCILGHIIPKNDYNRNFLPSLQGVIDDLEEYHKTIDTTFRGLNTPMPSEFIQKYNMLCENSRMKYRSVIEELRRYYKA